MKNFVNRIASFNGFILALVVILGFGFAGARYEIYRLSPAPKSGEMIAGSNGKWKGVQFADYIMTSQGYVPEDEEYGIVTIQYDEDNNKYITELKSYGGLTTGNQSGGVANFTTNAKGQYPQTFYWNPNSIGVLIDVIGDTTGIEARQCCHVGNEFRIVFSRADTLLKNTFIPYMVNYQNVVQRVYN